MDQSDIIELYVLSVHYRIRDNHRTIYIMLITNAMIALFFYTYSPDVVSSTTSFTISSSSLVGMTNNLTRLSSC